MSDVHVSNKYAVFRFLCADISAPIQIAALKKTTDGGYEFTFGSGTLNTTKLPGFIYDDDPAFYATYGVSRQ